MQIVELLVPYVREGDALVDMCCGSNDFSVLLKRGLGRAGRRHCQFRNYDIMQPKVGGMGGFRIQGSEFWAHGGYNTLKRPLSTLREIAFRLFRV